jgi:hypothetical protein
MSDVIKGLVFGGLMGFWIFVILIAMGIATADSVVKGAF